jgi:hypothetical protein
MSSDQKTEWNADSGHLMSGNCQKAGRMDRKEKIKMIAALGIVLIMWAVMAAGVMKYGY